MTKEKKVKWIVWYRHNILDKENQEFQDVMEFTNWFEAVYYYIVLSRAFGHPRTWRKIMGFEIKMYHVKPDKK